VVDVIETTSTNTGYTMSVVSESDVRYGIIRPTATQGVVMQSAEYWPWACAWCIPQVH
jgi:hypothetical protein